MTEWAQWTEEQDNQIRSGIARGMKAEAIAAEIGRTANAVKNRITIIGANSREYNRTGSRQLADWPDLPSDAFRDVKVSADPKIQLTKPQSRTLAGVS